MEQLSELHYCSIRAELTHPTAGPTVEEAWKPKRDFGPIPTSLSAETWTPAEFKRRGFTSRPIPTKPTPTMKLSKWNKHIKTLKEKGIYNTGWTPAINEVRDWLHLGCPPYITTPGNTPTDLEHHITPEQVHPALEAIESFLAAKHMAGPFTEEELPYDKKTIKYISIFGKARPHGGSLRIINDHSSPPNTSFNNGISDALLNSINLHMSTLTDIITTLFMTGPESNISKHDLKEAFQNLAVHPTQYPLQVYRILGSYFVATKMTYGDKQACHRFSRAHEVMIRYLILPQCNISPGSVEMVVDDVTAITNKDDKETLKEFDAAYKNTLAFLGFKTKEDDPLGYKAFSQQQQGEVLGFLLNTKTLKWSLSREKNAKIIEAIDQVYDKHNLRKKVPVKLKVAQAAAGKINAIQACTQEITRWLLFINRDLANYIKQNPSENLKSLKQQKQKLIFSNQAKQDLHFVRAFLINIHQHWIPLQDPRRTETLIPDVVIHTDASGQTDELPDQPGAALGVFIPPQPNTTSRAVSFPIPKSFLLAEDDVGKNHHNTLLLEGLAILTAMTRYPNTFYKKTALFVTDSLSFKYIWKSGRTKGIYTANLLRCLHNVATRLRCKVEVTWQKRCSTTYNTAADTLTHQTAEGIPAHVQYRRVETLPHPIQKTLETSLKFEENTFHRMWPEIVRYWNNPTKHPPKVKLLP